MEMTQAKVTQEITGKLSAMETAGIENRKFNSDTSTRESSWEYQEDPSVDQFQDKWKFVDYQVETPEVSGKLLKEFSFTRVKLLNKTFTQSCKNLI